MLARWRRATPRRGPPACGWCSLAARALLPGRALVGDARNPPARAPFRAPRACSALPGNRLARRAALPCAASTLPQQRTAPWHPSGRARAPPTNRAWEAAGRRALAPAERHPTRRTHASPRRDRRLQEAVAGAQADAAHAPLSRLLQPAQGEPRALHPQPRAPAPGEKGSGPPHRHRPQTHAQLDP